jgi:hypothetical protein
LLFYNVPCTFGQQISGPEAIICVIASQLANVGESIIGAALQEKEGFRWVGNHFNNFISIFFFWYLFISTIHPLYSQFGMIGSWMLGFLSSILTIEEYQKPA